MFCVIGVQGIKGKGEVKERVHFRCGVGCPNGKEYPVALMLRTGPFFYRKLASHVSSLYRVYLLARKTHGFVSRNALLRVRGFWSFFFWPPVPLLCVI